MVSVALKRSYMLKDDLIGTCFLIYTVNQKDISINDTGDYLIYQNNTIYNMPGYNNINTKLYINNGITYTISGGTCN